MQLENIITNQAETSKRYQGFVLVFRDIVMIKSQNKLIVLAAYAIAGLIFLNVAEKLDIDEKDIFEQWA